MLRQGIRKLNKNIVKNFISTSSGVGVSFFVQIVLVPIFLLNWGVDKYSDWIIINSIVNLFLTANVGFNAVLANDIVKGINKTQQRLVNELVSINFFISCFLTIILIISAFICLEFVHLVEILNLHHFRNAQLSSIIPLLCSSIGISLISGVFNSIFRANEKYHYITAIDNLIRFGDAIVLAIGVYLGLSLRIIILFQIILKLTAMIWKYYSALRLFEFKINFKYITVEQLRRVLPLSLSFLCFPLSNAIILQGYAIIIGMYFSPSVLVAFITIRTLTNFIKSVMGVVVQSIWPELSIKIANGQKSNVVRMVKLCVVVSLTLSIVVGTVILLWGDSIYAIWLRGEIQFDFNLALIFMIAMFASNLWNSMSVLLLADNKHSSLAYSFLISVLILFVCALGLSKLGYGIYAISSTLIFIELPLVLLSFRLVGNSLKENYSNLPDECKSGNLA